MQYIAIDQYGDTVKLYSNHPRKELMENHCTTHADKIYRDTADGEAKHIGYIVVGLWYTIYKVTPFKEK